MSTDQGLNKEQLALENRAEFEAERKKNRQRARFLRQVLPKGAIGAEVGVHKGYFTRFLLKITRPTKLHLIDLWYLYGSEWDWGIGNRSTVDALASILHRCEDELVRGQVILHIGDDLGILARFPDDFFDWIYLDTGHQYEQTIAELFLLKSKVKKEGTIAGDDWQVDPAHCHHGVCKAVKEFIQKEPYELIYASETDFQWAIQFKSHGA